MKQLKYARLLFNLPMPDGYSIPAKTWLELTSIETHSASFKTNNGVDTVTLEFLKLEDPPAGTIIYGTQQRIR